jgi:methionine synthase II (cobalamin-independent)
LYSNSGGHPFKREKVKKLKKKIMKTINELWDELTNHPDYVTGSLWTVEDVASNFECEVESYLEDELNLEEIDEADIEKYSLDIVKQNIEIFKNTIMEFESYSYEYGTWEITIDELNIPEFEVTEIV